MNVYCHVGGCTIRVGFLVVSAVCWLSGVEFESEGCTEGTTASESERDADVLLLREFFGIPCQMIPSINGVFQIGSLIRVIRTKSINLIEKISRSTGNLNTLNTHLRNETLQIGYSKN